MAVVEMGLECSVALRRLSTHVPDQIEQPSAHGLDDLRPIHLPVLVAEQPSPPGLLGQRAESGGVFWCGQWGEAIDCLGDVADARTWVRGVEVDDANQPAPVEDAVVRREVPMADDLVRLNRLQHPAIQHLGRQFAGHLVQ